MHWHFDAPSILFTAIGVALVFHVARVAGAYIGTHGPQGIGTGIGAFFSFPVTA